LQLKTDAMIRIPSAGELSAYYQTYLKYLSAGDDLLALVKRQRDETADFLAGISEEQASKAYAPGKWLLKEVVGHVCDTERIMCYRALCIARKDTTPLPGFDENSYTPASNYASRTLANIASELKSVRDATIPLVENFSPEAIDRSGFANESPVSVRAIIFMIYVHQQHHMTIIKERYLA
jgi:hypothetical protein